MTLHRACPFPARIAGHVGMLSLLLIGITTSASVRAESIFRYGFDPLAPAPVVQVLRDDRVATLEMDYAGENAWGQWWTMDGGGRDDAGSWSPGGPRAPVRRSSSPRDPIPATTAASAASRRASRPTRKRAYDGWSPATAACSCSHCSMPRPTTCACSASMRSARSRAWRREFTFDGGDAARVDALRSSLTHFDDFNLPLGPADEKLWNNATVTSTDARFNLFFINDQYHAHTLNGTRVGTTPATVRRHRNASAKPVRIESGTRRRIVFDMDSPFSSALGLVSPTSTRSPPTSPCTPTSSTWTVPPACPPGPCASAARTTLSTRWMFDPNIATTTRPFASGPPKMRIKDSPTSRSLTPVPSPLRVGEVGEQAGHAGLPQLGEAADVEELLVHRAPIDLEVAGVDDEARLGAEGVPHRVRARCAAPGAARNRCAGPRCPSPAARPRAGPRRWRAPRASPG